MPAESHNAAGALGERLAAHFLKKLGYRVLQRNCRSRRGETDIIAQDGNAVVFVEVKTRTSQTWGQPETAVTLQKQRRLACVAVAFSNRHRLRERPLRFDIIAVLIEEGVEPQVKHYKDAFPLPESVKW